MNPTRRLEVGLPKKVFDQVKARARHYELPPEGYVLGVVLGHLPPLAGQRTSGIERARKKTLPDAEACLREVAKVARQTFKRGLCAICQSPELWTMVRDLREQGLSYTRIAAGTGLSRWTLAHHEPHRIALVAAPEPKSGCIVCDLGEETKAVVFHARRRRRSVQLIATAIGVSRTALQAHLRRCLPSSIGLRLGDPRSFSTLSVVRALDAIDRSS